MKTYYFHVTLRGDASSPEEAWRDACENFSLYCGKCPDESEYEVEEYEEEKDDSSTD